MYHCKKIKSWENKSLRQPASADFWVFSTCCFQFIPQTQKSPQKSAEAGCLKLLSFHNLLFCTV